MDTRKAHTVPYNSVSAPSECLALWQRQQLNMSVRHASSVVDMLGANVERHALYLPVFIVLHIIHTPSPTGATHITHKNQNTLHTSKSAMVPAEHPSSI